MMPGLDVEGDCERRLSPVKLWEVSRAIEDSEAGESHEDRSRRQGQYRDPAESGEGFR